MDGDALGKIKSSRERLKGDKKKPGVSKLWIKLIVFRYAIWVK